VPVVRFRRVREAAAPRYMTAGAAGFDLSAAVQAPLSIPPGGRAAVPTGIVLEIPEGYEGQVRPRSGLAKKWGVGLANAPGTIDSDYRGEVEVLVANHGAEPFVVEPGMRIAQLVVVPVALPEPKEVAELPESERGERGFGSSAH
jgi:dUTP diphosphatase